VPEEFASINLALDAWEVCDTILVGPGVYTETIEIPWGVTLLSTHGPEATIIDAQQQGAALQALAPSPSPRGLFSTTIQGFTITGGNDSGIRITRSDPVFRDCIIRENSSPSSGGGVRCWDASPTFEDCIIAGNTATFGGGAWINMDSEPKFENCTFVSNSASGGGGGLFSNGSSDPMLDRCILAFSVMGEAMTCQGGGDARVSCCDLFGNADGDELCGDDYGGNFSADPLFCDLGDGDWTLATGSPCLPEGNGCNELVGALGLGCDLPVQSPEQPPAKARIAVFPNPFNPSTRIQFSCPYAEPVSLRVFDLSGRTVRTLAEGIPFAVGDHEVTWNGTDDHGQPVSSGVYILKAEIGNWQVGEKLVLLK